MPETGWTWIGKLYEGVGGWGWGWGWGWGERGIWIGGCDHISTKHLVYSNWRSFGKFKFKFKFPAVPDRTKGFLAGFPPGVAVSSSTFFAVATKNGVGVGQSQLIITTDP